MNEVPLYLCFPRTCSQLPLYIQIYFLSLGPNYLCTHNASQL